MRKRFLCILLLASSCALAPPVIVSVNIGGGNVASSAFARTNLRQTLIIGRVAFSTELMTADGVPVFAHNVLAGVQLYIDRDEDVRIEAPVGTPLPASARVLFPRPGEAKALGITFDAD